MHACIGFRYLMSSHCTNIQSINGSVLDWVDEMRYLDIYLVSSSKFNFAQALFQKQVFVCVFMMLWVFLMNKVNYN